MAFHRWRTQYALVIAAAAAIVFGLGVLVCRNYGIESFFSGNVENIENIESTSNKIAIRKQSLISNMLNSRGVPDRNEIEDANRRIEALPAEEQPAEVLKWANTKMPRKWAIVTRYVRLHSLLPDFTEVFLGSFGLSGIAITHMTQSIMNIESVPVISIDTLHLFPETYELVERIRKQFKLKQLHIYKSREASSREEFESRFGPFLWRADPPLYDYITKVNCTEIGFGIPSASR